MHATLALVHLSHHTRERSLSSNKIKFKQIVAFFPFLFDATCVHSSHVLERFVGVSNDAALIFELQYKQTIVLAQKLNALSQLAQRAHSAGGWHCRRRVPLLPLGRRVGF